VCFTVTGFRANQNGEQQALLSRRVAQKYCEDQYISKLLPGDCIQARVTHLESFGAFCDIGCGIVSLIPIDAISVSRISHPRDRFSPGDDIRTVVKSRDLDGRVTLTHKELLGTWEENAASFSMGETVSGIIRSVEEYGVFVELTPNLAGLAEPWEGAKPGQYASVFIKSILPEKMKLKLVIIDSFDDESSGRKTHKYFYVGGHMDRFVYSPATSPKVVETVF
jgi:small subunit ribosomal protein S1